MKKTLITLAALAAIAIAPAAFAASNNSTLTVNASVAANCTITNATLNFGAYDPLSGANLDGTTTITVACTKGITPTIGLAASGRTMSDGTDTLTYELYKDAGRSTVWGDTGAALFTPPSAPGRAGTAYTIFGRIPGAQDVGSGSYTGNLQATVNF